MPSTQALQTNKFQNKFLQLQNISNSNKCLAHSVSSRAKQILLNFNRPVAVANGFKRTNGVLAAEQSLKYATV